MYGRNETLLSYYLVNNRQGSSNCCRSLHWRAVGMSSAALYTIPATNVWLVGQPLHCIKNLNQLSIIGEVLRRVVYDLKVKKLMLSTSYNNAVYEMLQVRHLANIPTTQKPNAIEKLKKLHQQLRNIVRSKLSWTLSLAVDCWNCLMWHMQSVIS